MANPARFLGFAFANADFIFEIDHDATVVFASGAASEFLGSKDVEIIGRGADRIFHPSDSVKFVTSARALKEGGRAGPLTLKLASGEAVLVSLCQLPQNGQNVSCTLSRPGQRRAFATATKIDAKTGLADGDSFLAAAAGMADANNAMTLVKVPQLPDACAKLPPDKADQLLQKIGKAVKAAGPKGAGRVNETTFAAIDKAGKRSRLGAKIQALLKEGGLDHAQVAETLVSLTGKELSEEQRLLAVHHAVSQLASGSHQGKPGEDISAVFDRMVQETQSRALQLTDIILNGNFSLAFQPVVDLTTGTLSHYETLTRFENGDNTGETIAFAESMGISDTFDVAVTAKVMNEVEHHREITLALNLSGMSVSIPSTFGLVAGLLAAKRNLASRVKIEVTESAQISDLAAANKAIQTLRAMGYKVGLDDFGAGAASFQYLHALEIDFVKFDASLIKNLGNSAREDALIGGLVKLCGELGIDTIGEGIETAEIKDRARAVGIRLGQGYHLGKPGTGMAEPQRPQRLGKRKGEQVSWG